MPSRVGFYREIYRMIQEGLCAKGMQRHSKGVYSRKITTDATGVVGLNAATRYDFSINPIIGVQFLPLEHLLAELKERAFHPTKSGDTIACPIGYLAPPYRFRQWTFQEDWDNAATVADMVHEITTVGFRYMEENSTLEAICERIAEECITDMNQPYHPPVGYLMLGRYDEAERVVRDHLAKIAAHKPPTIEEIEADLGEKLDARALARLEELEDQPIPAHENYRRFAERFFRRLDEERANARREE